MTLDLYSRKVVGWAMDRTMTAKLVGDAYQMALEQRKPDPGLIFIILIAVPNTPVMIFKDSSQTAKLSPACRARGIVMIMLWRKVSLAHSKPNWCHVTATKNAPLVKATFSLTLRAFIIERGSTPQLATIALSVLFYNIVRSISRFTSFQNGLQSVEEI